MTDDNQYRYATSNGFVAILPKNSLSPSGYAPFESAAQQIVDAISPDLANANRVALYAAKGLLASINIKVALDSEQIANKLVSALKGNKLIAFKQKAEQLKATSSYTASPISAASNYSYTTLPVSTGGIVNDQQSRQGVVVNDEAVSKPVAEHATAGDPISMLTGEEILPLIDFELSGQYTVTWRRLYRSSKCDRNLGLGFGWSHNYSLQLIERYDAPPKIGPKKAGRHWLELIDEDGNEHAFEQVKCGQYSYQQSSGLTLFYESTQRMILTRSDDSIWTFRRIEERWLLHSISDRKGGEITLTYDQSFRLYRVSCSEKRGFTLHYNSQNNLLRVVAYYIDQNNQQQDLPNLLASYQYDDNQSLIAAIDSNGCAEKYQYFVGSLLKSRTRASGFSHHFEWIGEGKSAKCCKQWGDDGSYCYQFTYLEQKTTSTNSHGYTEHYYHNEHELLTAFVDANGNKTSYQYDHYLRKVKEIDAQNNVTSFVYNDRGQLSEVIDSQGNRTRYAYNDFGQRILRIDPVGHIFKWKFSPFGRLLSETLPDGREVTYRYTDKGLISQKIDEQGIQTDYSWDDNGELLAEKRSDQIRRYSYDQLGRINASIDGNGLVTEYTRNSQGQISELLNYSQQTPNDKQSTQYHYDQAGRLLKIQSANGDTTHYTYAGLAQPSKKIFADGSWLNYQYDKERNLTAIERSDEAVYQIQYSPTEKPIKTVGFDGREQHYRYDAKDDLIEVKDSHERIITYKRDSHGRIVDQHSSFSTRNSQAAYNHHNFYQYDKIGRLLIAHNNERVVAHQYHGNGQIKQSKQGQWLLDYSFTEQGRRQGLGLPDGTHLQYVYDGQGRIASIQLQTEHAGKRNNQLIVSRQYSKMGQLQTQKLGNGISLTQCYDSFARLIKQTWADQSEQINIEKCYAYDEIDQLIGYQQTNLGNNNKVEKHNFKYNKLSQLTSNTVIDEADIKTTDESRTYQWDAFGNPKENHFPTSETTDTKTNASLDYTCVVDDRVISFAGTDFDYDSSGNQISAVASGLIQQRSFDGLNQLRQLNHNGQLTHYEYDALGRRSAKITEKGKTEFIWDGNQLIGEHHYGQFTWYVYLPNTFEPIALIQNREIYYYHLDQLATPICLTDRDCNQVWCNQGDVFGAESHSKANSLEPVKRTTNTIDNPIRFQGQYFDNESGLHYNRFRYYCPKQGRFIHQDPIGLAGGINAYQYAPNPVNWVDPFGLSCKEDSKSGELTQIQKDYIAVTCTPLYGPCASPGGQEIMMKMAEGHSYSPEQLDTIHGLGIIVASLVGIRALGPSKGNITKAATKTLDDVSDIKHTISGPGSDLHRAERWKEYQARGGEWTKDRWDKQYDVNMQQANKSHKAVAEYRKRNDLTKEDGWDTEKTLRDEQGNKRRLDIVNEDTLEAIEHKKGKQYLSKDILSEVERDAALRNNTDWDIRWHFDDHASKPLINKLDEMGIPWTIGD